MRGSYTNTSSVQGTSTYYLTKKIINRSDFEGFGRKTKFPVSFKEYAK